MSELVIGPPLADQLRALAEREKRPIDAVLTDMLLRYQSPLSDDEVDTWLAASGITLPVSNDDTPPPISPDEERALADEIGRAGPLSALIIEERHEGP
jgi:hypothetical protein